MKFIFHATDPQGHPRSDTLEAADRQAALRELEARGFGKVSLVEVPAGKPQDALQAQLEAASRQVGESRQRLRQAAARPPLEAGLEGVLEDQPSLGLRDLALFTTQFGVLLKAGVPITQALNSLSGPQGAGAVAGRLACDLTRGQRLSGCMRRFPQLFDPMYLRMIYLGEETGRLVQVLERLTQALARRVEVRSKLSQALVYPAVLLTFSLGITAFLLYYMLPQFLATFTGSSLPLPPLTRAVMLLVQHPLLRYGLPAGVLGLLLGVVTFRHHPRLRAGSLWLAFHAPVLGRVHYSRAMARTCADLAALLEVGVPLNQALELLVGTSGSRQLDEALGAVRVSIEEGATLAQSMAAQSAFPRLVTSTVAAAEPAGQLSYLLGRVAEILELQAEVQTDQALQLVEPAILTGLGLMVGTIVLAIFLPVYQLTTLSL